MRAWIASAKSSKRWDVKNLQHTCYNQERNIYLGKYRAVYIIDL